MRQIRPIGPKDLLLAYHESPLYRNALLLIINSAVLSGFGFIFWAIIARLFPVNEVGLATALISLLELILVFSLVGFNVSLIRYLPKSKDKKKLISSCFIISGLIALIIGAISLAAVSLFSPVLSKILGIWVYALFFILSAATYTLFTLTDSVLIAHRDARWVVLKSLIFSILKLALPLLLIALGAFGIFMSVEISAFIALIAIWVFWSSGKSFKIAFAFDKAIIKKMLGFNASNYIANIMLSAPALVMPLILASTLGPEAAAYFYYPIMIYSLISIIPFSIAQSLLAEGSNSIKSLKKNIRKSFFLSYLLIIPCVLLIFLFGKQLLSVFGSSYTKNSFRLLQLLAISSLFSAGNIIYIAVSNIRQRTRKVIHAAFLVSVGIITFSLILIGKGLPGIGIAWIIGHLLANILVYSDFMLNKDLFWRIS